MHSGSTTDKLNVTIIYEINQNNWLTQIGTYKIIYEITKITNINIQKLQNRINNRHYNLH